MATATPSILCDPCKEAGDEEVSVAFCLECRELYCNSCLKCHRKMKLTTSHSYVFISGDESGETIPCDLCNTDTEKVESLCIECREIYCTACTNRHRNFKASKHHTVVAIVSEKSDFNITYSGAQVPVNKHKQQNQQYGTSVNIGESRSSVLDDNITTQGSKPLHSDIAARRSDVKQTLFSVIYHCKFSVSTPTDKNPANINRMISMPDGRICLVDRGDYKLKLYSDEFVFCNEVFLPGCTAVTCVDDDTLAVATRSDIRRYSVKGNKITQTGRTLHIDGVIYDTAYRRGDFITRYSKDNTDYTCCGSKLIVIQHRESVLGDFMQYDHTSDFLLLGNFLERTITCYTLNGDVKWRIPLKGGPSGMMVVHGVVLAAEYSDHAIRQITMEGHLLSTPLLTKDHGITSPKAIAYQHKQQRLLVTKRYDDSVLMFNLSQKKLQ